MDKGLSHLQRWILSRASKPSIEAQCLGVHITTADIIAGYYHKPTPRAYAAVSRAMRRLEARGLLCRRDSWRALPGGGAVGWVRG